MLIVPIVAACGLRMPKTSSRAITSPAGTADTMETLAPVDLDVAQIQRVVERTGGCVVWGGAVRLSPADDILIRVERPLDLDSQGQLVASVLSKKAAAGATHVLIDMPVGPTAKVRSAHAAPTCWPASSNRWARRSACRCAWCRPTALAPVGRGIGPALEARDVLAVLRRETERPGRPGAARAATGRQDAGVRRRRAARGRASHLATAVLDDGRAWRKFQEICEAQGGMREPPVAPHRQGVVGATQRLGDRHRQPAPGAHRQAGRRAQDALRRHRPARADRASSWSAASRCSRCTPTRPANWPMRAEYAASQADTVHVIEDA